MFILNSIGIFVKLIQEYRGGPKFIQVGKGIADFIMDRLLGPSSK